MICSAPAAAAPLPVPYTRLDATAQVTTPGSYAFVDATGHVVTTYEAMRDGTATRLRIHTSDAVGTPHASLYAAVAVGDVVEWRVADDCWVRYEVTSLLPDPPATAPRKLRFRGRVGGLRLHGLRGGRRSGSGRAWSA